MDPILSNIIDQDTSKMPRGGKSAGKAAPATPATPGGAGDGPPAPTSQEAMLFFNMIKNLKTKPDIDWGGVAKDSGFKNAETAKASFLPFPSIPTQPCPVWTYFALETL